MGAEKINPVSINQQFMDELTHSVQRVFKEMFNADAKLESSKIENHASVIGDVSGIVGLVQKQYEGNLIMSFSKAVIFDLLGRVYARQFTEIDEVVREGAAELTNMVYGQLKLKLNARGHDLKMALPNVVLGPQHNIQALQTNKSLVAKFTAGGMPFAVMVSLNDGTTKK